MAIERSLVSNSHGVCIVERAGRYKKTHGIKQVRNKQLLTLTTIGSMSINNV